MKNNHLCLGLIGSSLLLLSACQNLENIFSDSGYGSGSSERVVVKPVPRTNIKSGTATTSTSRQETAGAVVQTTPGVNGAPATITSSPQPQASPQGAVKRTSDNGQAVVPNVAPSLGE